MASVNLEQGVQAIQRQEMEQGKRLIRVALRNDSLTPQEQVQAYLWLAEADPNPQFKIEQYQNALKIDPSNQDVLNRLSYWQQYQPNQQGLTPSQGMRPANPQDFQQQTAQNQAFQQGLTPSQGMRPVNPQQVQQGLTPSQRMPAINPQQDRWTEGNTPATGQQPPIQQQGQPSQTSSYGQEAPTPLQSAQRSVGVLGGANGHGTGFFVTRDGLIATTRHIVGGERQMTIQLLDGRQISGHVVRSFPLFDLALIKSNVQLNHLLNITQSSTILDNTPIVAVTHAGDGIRSAKRRSVHQNDAHWFPTIINHLKDAGGNPVFDGQNMLVGMLTSNASRSNGYMYGLHIHKIYECVDQYLAEKAQFEGQNTIYCHGCGIISRAPSFGGQYCEHCGVTHPYALDVTRSPQPNLAAIYGENTQRPCPNCASQVGFYRGVCMRCGFEL